MEHLSDHVLVMHRGRLIESAPAEELYAHPREEYTRELLQAAAAGGMEKARIVI